MDADLAERRGHGVTSDGGDGLLHGRITRVVIGGMYAVHRELGAGFLESVYANGLTVLLRHAGVHVEREVTFEVMFHGERIGWYRADMVVERKVVVEVKAGRLIHPKHCAQVLNYLRASNLEVGLLLNFGPTATCKRIISSRNRDRPA